MAWEEKLDAASTIVREQAEQDFNEIEDYVREPRDAGRVLLSAFCAKYSNAVAWYTDKHGQRVERPIEIEHLRVVRHALRVVSATTRYRPELMSIPAGSHLEAFAMMGTTVTGAQYRTLMERACRTDGELPALCPTLSHVLEYANALSLKEGFSPCYVIARESASLLSDADGYRLPTVAEWDHALQAGEGTNTREDIDEVAWWAGNSHNELKPVGRKRANKWGLYDMLGNVDEFCWTQEDVADLGGPVFVRGGSFRSGEDEIRRGGGDSLYD